MSDFKLSEFTRRGGELLVRTRKTFDDYKDLHLSEVALPKTMQAQDGPIKLVFVGQYSSGKSSIIKMLSGIDTEIGAGIKTQEAHSYKWGDLEIVDTPGIHTEVRPDHDEKSYYEINHAALLIFVVTSQGFDNKMGNHFKKLAFEQKRAKNMVLVINKMDQTSLGNVPEQQQIIAKDLQKVIDPYTPEQLYLSFTDTESYFEWLNETDEEMKEIYFEQSGYQKFVDNLNAFVASRGVLSKIQAPLETLKSAITSIIGESDNLSTDKDIDALEEVFNRRKKTLNEGKHRIKVEIEELANTCAQQIRTEGSTAANAICEGATEESVKRAIEAAQLQAETYINSCEQNMISRIQDICADIDSEISEMDRSNFTLNVQTNIANKVAFKPVESDASSPESNLISSLKNTKSLKSGVVNISMTSKAASKLSTPSILGLGEINLASIVKDVGHFFNFKFAPWGAVNVVKGFSKALGYVGIALTAYDILSKVFGDDKEKEMRDNLRKAQDEVIQQFDQVSKEVKHAISSAAEKVIAENIDPVVSEVDRKLSDFQSKKARLKNMNKSLQVILKDVDSLMDDVQRTAKA